jgi:hypothetical protein
MREGRFASLGTQLVTTNHIERPADKTVRLALSSRPPRPRGASAAFRHHYAIHSARREGTMNPTYILIGGAIAFLAMG